MRSLLYLTALLGLSFPVFSLPLRDTRVTRIGVGSHNEQFTVSINVEDLKVQGDRLLKTDQLIGLTLDYVLSVGLHGITIQQKPVKPHALGSMEASTTFSTVYAADGVSTAQRALVRSKEGQITAEVRARVEESPGKKGCIGRRRRQVVVSTRIVDISGAQVTTQDIEHVFPLLRHPCTTLFCHLAQSFGAPSHSAWSSSRRREAHHGIVHDSLDRPVHFWDAREGHPSLMKDCSHPLLGIQYRNVISQIAYFLLMIASCIFIARLLVAIVELTFSCIVATEQKSDLIKSEHKTWKLSESEDMDEIDPLPIYDPACIPAYEDLS